MKLLLKGAKVYCGSNFMRKDILIDSGIIADISDFISPGCADTVYIGSRRGAGRSRAERQGRGGL